MEGTWKYGVGDVVEGGMEMQWKIEHRVIDIANAQRIYIVSGIEGEQNMCAIEFENSTNKKID